MSDKKVIPIGGGGGTSESIVVDDALSTSSTNPVQNKVITSELNNKPNKATTLSGYGITNAYTKTEVDNKVAGVINSAPETLDTLKELANALGNDANFATTVATQIGKKANTADLAKVATSGSYNDLSNKPTIPTIPTSLPANGGNADTVNGHTVLSDVPANAKFTDTTYSNATTSNAGLMSATDKAKLDATNIAYATCDTEAATAAKVVTVTGNDNWALSVGCIVMVKFSISNTAANVTLNVNGTGAYPIWHNNAEYESTSSAYCGYAGRTITYSFNGTHWVWVSSSYDANTQSNTNSTDTSSKIYLVGATSQGTNKTTYSHNTVYVGTDGHVYSNSKQAVNLSDSQALTNKTYNGYTLAAACAKGVDTTVTSGSANLPTSGAVYTAIANSAYTLPTASSSTLGGVKTTSTVTSTSGLTACPIISGVPYYKDTNNTYTLGSFGVTATATELNVLDGITATVTELNYCDGVTSNIQTQLNGKLSTSGTAAKATADASGNTITSTYATKTEVNNGLAGKLGTAGGNITGHLYLTGAQASSSTGNTSQIVFGTSTSNHVCISSNEDAIVINRSLTETNNQIVLYLDKASQFPNGITGNASSATKLNSDAGSGTQPIYFSGGKPVACTYSLGKSVPSDAKFTDTTYSAATTSAAGLMSAADKIKLDGIAVNANNYTYTLPAATSSVLGGVKVGTNISVSSGTISVANGSTSAKGVVQLTDSTSSTSTTTAATPASVKSAYDLANGKQSPATTLSGYGITDAYTKTSANSNFVGWDRGAFNADELYNGGVFMIAQGTNVPSGSKYGSLLVMPYRQLTGNTKTDFGTQIFIPNGDDSTSPNSMFFRTSLGASWNAWQEVATRANVYTKTEVDSLVGKSLGMKAVGSERSRASNKPNYGL